MEEQETIIYRLTMINPRQGAYFPVWIFWATSELLVGKRARLRSQEPSRTTIKGAHWVDLLGQFLSLNHVFEIFMGSSLQLFET